jgi:DNA-binding transcriptional ArsR family regulator
VFKALADGARRVLLDALYVEDGQTLGALCGHLPAMTRFGVMKHLAVLEHAGLVVTHRAGRSKHHYLNPVPIREIHDRWITKYAEPVAAAMAGLRSQLENRTA